jgi:hypothetical protein
MLVLCYNGGLIKTYWYIPLSVKIRRNLQTLYNKTYVYLCVYFEYNSLCLEEWKVFQTNVAEKMKHNLYAEYALLCLMVLKIIEER